MILIHRALLRTLIAGRHQASLIYCFRTSFELFERCLSLNGTIVIYLKAFGKILGTPTTRASRKIAHLRKSHLFSSFFFISLLFQGQADLLACSAYWLSPFSYHKWAIWPVECFSKSHWAWFSSLSKAALIIHSLYDRSPCVNHRLLAIFPK